MASTLLKRVLGECANPECSRVCEHCGTNFQSTLTCPKCKTVAEAYLSYRDTLGRQHTGHQEEERNEMRIASEMREILHHMGDQVTRYGEEGLMELEKLVAELEAMHDPALADEREAARGQRLLNLTR